MRPHSTPRQPKIDRPGRRSRLRQAAPRYLLLTSVAGSLLVHAEDVVPTTNPAAAPTANSSAPSSVAPPADGQNSTPPLVLDASPTPLTLSVSAQHQYDDNYTRTPDKQSERISAVSGEVSLDKTISQQRITASLRATDSHYAKRDYLNKVTYNAGVEWLSRFASRWVGDLSWQRKRDRVPFSSFQGDDVVTDSDLNGSLGYEISPEVTAYAGAEQANQDHSNSERQLLNHEDRQGFVGVKYKSGRDSTVDVRFRDGRRDYDSNDALDYRYKQIETHVGWQITDKTKLSGMLGHFRRTGDINQGSGTIRAIQGDWAPTGKTSFTARYQVTYPAAGGDNTSPSREQRALLKALWQATAKLGFTAQIEQIRGRFNGFLTPSHSENTLRTSLLTSYMPTEKVHLDLELAHERRHSTLEGGNYRSNQVMGIVRLDF